MLVLSRRENEKVLFPYLGITIEVLKIKGNQIRLGIDAPPEIAVIRSELADKFAACEASVPASPPDLNIRQRLHDAADELHQLHQQLEAGNPADAEANIFRIFSQLQTLDEEVAAIPGTRPPQPRPKQKRALLVDDNLNESKLLASFLRCRKFEVATAGDGADAMQYLTTHGRPDFVLLDMQMPKFDGRWTINQIRSQEQFDGLKVFAVSGADPIEYGVEIGPAGIDQWFRKPLDPETLVGQMDAHCSETLA